jgi:hypothetical protein
MVSRKDEDDFFYPADEARRRMDTVVKRMLNTPPQPRRAKDKPTETKERPVRKARSKPPS